MALLPELSIKLFSVVSFVSVWQVYLSWPSRTMESTTMARDHRRWRRRELTAALRMFHIGLVRIQPAFNALSSSLRVTESSCRYDMSS